MNWEKVAYLLQAFTLSFIVPGGLIERCACTAADAFLCFFQELNAKRAALGPTASFSAVPIVLAVPVSSALIQFPKPFVLICSRP